MFKMDEYAIVNGTIVDKEKRYEATIFVKDGKISKIEEGHIGTGDLDVVDVKGKYILPGLIDVHVHFRNPGNPEKEDWTTGSKAALAGGVATVLDMPNNNPPITTVALLDAKRKSVKDEAMVNYGFYIGATPDNIKEIKKAKNIAGVKVYMGSSTGNLLVDKKEDLERLMAQSGKLLALHAESEKCICKGQEEHTDEFLPQVHSYIRGPICAHEAVREALHLSKKYHAKIHICHCSTAVELQDIRKFKNGNVSVEVTPHHLFLNIKDYDLYGNMVKVNPPLREEADQVALWEGIKDGTVDIVATDHAPHLLKEKEKDYNNVPSGLPGVQMMLPLLLNAVNEEKLSLEKVVELTSFNPARIFGIKDKGMLKEGYDADITIVDMEMAERVDNKYMWSKAKWTPFNGLTLKGWPVMTFVNGKLMYEWRTTFHKGTGREVNFI